MSLEKWKLDMLRQMISGDTPGSEKQNVGIGKGKKKSPGSDQEYPKIDLHRFDKLSDQLIRAEKAIDQALASGAHGLVIIHGKGKGVLKNELLKALRKHPHISGVRELKDLQWESGAVLLTFK